MVLEEKQQNHKKPAFKPIYTLRSHYRPQLPTGASPGSSLPSLHTGIRCPWLPALSPAARAGQAGEKLVLMALPEWRKLVGPQEQTGPPPASQGKWPRASAGYHREEHHPGLSPEGEQGCDTGGGVTAERGSVFTKPCQMFSPSGEEHLTLPEQPALLPLITTQKMLKPLLCCPEDPGWVTLASQSLCRSLGDVCKDKGPSWRDPPSGDGLCPVLAGRPHFWSSSVPTYCSASFSLKKSRVPGDGDLVEVAKGCGSCWQMSPSASPCVSSRPVVAAASSCGERGKAEECW